MTSRGSDDARDPNDAVEFGNTSIKKKTLKRAGILSSLSLAALVTTCSSYKVIPAQNYGVRITAGQIKSDHVPPGIYLTWPVYDTIYKFNNNTIIFEAQAGAAPSGQNGSFAQSDTNTQDQNPFSADMRLHYRVDPKKGLIALHIGTMSGDNGQSLLQTLMTQSVNAVVGSRPATDTLKDPQTFLRAFHENLQWRINQNNVPVSLDSVELLTMNVGALRVPVQARLASDGKFEWMAGPAAVSVPYVGGPTAPAANQPSTVFLPAAPAPK